MTKPTMSLAELVEKGADVDLLREMLAYMAEQLMEHDVAARCGVNRRALSTPDRRATVTRAEFRIPRILGDIL